jgi:hypothetical protein
MREGKSIYIAGPMTGIKDLNRSAFEKAAERLSAEGWTVYDPVEIGEMYGTAEELEADPELLAQVIKAELGFVARADAIYLLDGWERSVGTKRELLVALGCGLDVIVEDMSKTLKTDGVGSENAAPDKGRAGGWARHETSHKSFNNQGE